MFLKHSRSALRPSPAKRNNADAVNDADLDFNTLRIQHFDFQHTCTTSQTHFNGTRPFHILSSEYFRLVTYDFHTLVDEPRIRHTNLRFHNTTGAPNTGPCNTTHRHFTTTHYSRCSFERKECRGFTPTQETPQPLRTVS